MEPKVSLPGSQEPANSEAV